MPSELKLPIVFNLTYRTAKTMVLPTGQPTKKNSILTITGARGLTGASSDSVVALTASSPDADTMWRVANPIVNGVGVLTVHGSTACATMPAVAASGLAGQCTTLMLRFGGSRALRHMSEATETSPPTGYSGGWFNTTLETDSAMFEQLQALQKSYPVPWDAADMDASWLGNRLLLFPYILEPGVNVTKPRGCGSTARSSL